MDRHCRPKERFEMKKILICFVALFCYSLGFAQEYKIHVVQPKETWGIIAVKYKIPMDELAKINNRTIKDTIFAGEGLKIPVFEKKKDIISNNSFLEIMSGIVSIFFLIVVFFYIRRKRIKTTQKSQKIIRLGFANKRVFEVKCFMEKEMICCPICKFRNKNPHRVAKHLKLHYKQNEELKSFKEVTV